MRICPACGTAVPLGQTICEACGTELVIGGAVPPSGPPVAVPEPTAAPVDARTCPECGTVAPPDPNGCCPSCGHDWEPPRGAAEIDEAEFFREPDSLDVVRARKRALLEARTRSVVRTATPPVASPGGDAGAVAGGAGGSSLPGDRRARFRGEGDVHTEVPSPWLEVEGGQTVFFEGRMTSRVRLDVDELRVGRRDPSDGWYPDIDLTHLRALDPHISRRHARLFRRGGVWFVEDVCANDATFLNDHGHVLNGEEIALSDGDRVRISDAIVLRFRLPRRAE